MEQGDDKPRGPQELAELLETREPVFLVGGQAVYLWALHYFERTADLAPVVSRDIDLLGNRSTLEEVALGKIWERKLIGYLETVIGYNSFSEG